MRDGKVLRMVQMTILIAIVLLMSFTPLGFFRTAGLEVSLLTIPVVIGAMVLGPVTGAVLGTVFGLMSFWQCFGMSPFGGMLLNIDPFFTFLVCVPTRALMGWLTGVIFRAVYRIDKTKTVSYFVGGLIGALLNTLFFMGMLVLLFWNTEFIQGLAGGKNILAFAAAFVGINGILELPASCLCGGAISKAVNKALKNM